MSATDPYEEIRPKIAEIISKFDEACGKLDALSQLVAPPPIPIPTTPIPIRITAEPKLATIEGEDAVFRVKLNADARAPFDFIWQGWTNATSVRPAGWTTVGASTSDAHEHEFVYPGKPPAGSERRIRVTVVNDESESLSHEWAWSVLAKPTEAVEEPTEPNPGTQTFDYWKVVDLTYPTLPRVDPSKGVFEARDETQLRALLGNDRTIICTPENYQASLRRLDLHRYRGLKLLSRERGGAAFDFAARPFANNNVHVTQCEDFEMMGFTFRNSQYYAMRLGASSQYGLNGGNKNVKLHHLLIEDAGSGGIKVDNGDSDAILTDGVELCNIEIRRTGRNPQFRDFCEGFYLGSGDGFVYQNRVRNVHIHHVLGDGRAMGAGTSGEFIEAKVYTENLLIEHFTVLDWQLGDSTSGGAIALAINAGVNYTGKVPTTGAEGYVVRDGRISGIRRIGKYQKGNGLMIGKAARIERVAIDGCDDAGVAFMQNVNASNGYFSNDKELDVLLRDVVLANNRTPFLVDYNNAPHKARVRTENMILTDQFAMSTHPSQGLVWDIDSPTYGVSPEEALAHFGGIRN